VGEATLGQGNVEAWAGFPLLIRHGCALAAQSCAACRGCCLLHSRCCKALQATHPWCPARWPAGAPPPLLLLLPSLLLLLLPLPLAHLFCVTHAWQT
jgi:hypothetical protein